MKFQKHAESEFYDDVRRHGKILDDQTKTHLYGKIRQGEETQEDREALLLGQMRHLYSNAARNTLQAADTEDRFQDYCVRLIERAGDFDPDRGEFSTFSGIVMNAVNYAAYRRQKNRKEFTQSEATSYEQADKATDPQKEVEQNELLENDISRLRDAMLRLRSINKDWHTLIVLYYGLNEQEPKNTSEIATERKQSGSNISQQLRRAMQELAYLMGRG